MEIKHFYYGSVQAAPVLPIHGGEDDAKERADWVCQWSV